MRVFYDGKRFGPYEHVKHLCDVGGKLVFTAKLGD